MAQAFPGSIASTLFLAAALLASASCATKKTIWAEPGELGTARQSREHAPDETRVARQSRFARHSAVRAHASFRNRIDGREDALHTRILVARRRRLASRGRRYGTT